jgi:DNA-binding PadR family transcriptional regulator
MSPVFRHGRLRLYLLKLLDDAPKHGYEVIRLLQDRFMGVYAPSPGTIYPRLARLEEEGLVTHDEVEGRKVYRLTEKGRAEIRERVDDLAELEEEITESVRDIAREVKEDVRETVRTLREEIARAARDANREGRRPQDDYDRIRDQARREAEEARSQAQTAREEGQREREEGRREREEGRREREGGRRERETGRRERDAWRRETDEQDERGRWEHGPSGGARRPFEDFERASEEAGARFRAGRGRPKKDWTDWASLKDWPGLRDLSGLKDWPGLRDIPGAHDWAGSGRMPGWPDPAKFRDLERLALQFASELRRVASHASAIGPDTFGDLRTILDEALTRIRTEIFEPRRSQEGPGGATADDEPGQDQPSSSVPAESATQDSTAQDSTAQDSTAQDSAGQAQPGDTTAHEKAAQDQE